MCGMGSTAADLAAGAGRRGVGALAAAVSPAVTEVVGATDVSAVSGAAASACARPARRRAVVVAAGPAAVERALRAGRFGDSLAGAEALGARVSPRGPAGGGGGGDPARLSARRPAGPSGGEAAHPARVSPCRA